MAVVDIENLTFNYGTHRVLDGFSLSLTEGRVLGLLGPNGVGKSTVINIINGFLEPNEGKVLVFGEPSSKLSPSTKERIGYLMEGHIQYGFMTIKEAEKFYSTIYPKWNHKLFQEKMDEAGILKKQPIRSMSCGQRSQTALAITMARDPDLFILDDFSMGLDPVYRRMFIQTLRDFVKQNNKTVLATSHIIQDIELLADDVRFMGKNKGDDADSLTDVFTFQETDGATLEDIYVKYYSAK